MTQDFRARSHPARHWPEAVAVLATLAVFAVAHGRQLLDPFFINDDVRQQVFWMQRWLDPDLYPDSIWVEYASLYVPPGVKAFHYALIKGLGLTPFTSSKALTGLLFTALGLGMFRLGRALWDVGLGFACLAGVWLLPFFLYNMSGGLSRSFVAPLLAWWAAGVTGQSRRTQAVVLLAAALCAPYACLILLTAAGLAWLARLAGRAKHVVFPVKLVDYALVLASAGIVLATSMAFDAAGFGPLVSRADMAGRPEFGPLGRYEIYPEPGVFLDLVYYPFERVGLFLEGGLLTGIVTLVVILASALYLSRKVPWRQLAPRLAGMGFLLAASLALYAAAKIVLLKLFVPDRYISYTWYIVITLGLALPARFGLDALWRRKTLAAGLVCLAAALGMWRLSGSGLFSYAAEAPLAAWAQTTAKNAVVAAPPKTADAVMTFGQRNVLASYKLAHVWAKGFWNRMEERYSRFFAAYYGDDPQAVRQLATDFGVDYLVVDEADFTLERLTKRAFFEPYGTRIREQAQHVLASGHGFTVLDRHLFPATSLPGGLRVIDLRKDAHPDPAQ